MMRRKGLKNLIEILTVFSWVSVFASFFSPSVISNFISPSSLSGYLSGINSVTSFSGLTSAASLDNVIRFDSYAAHNPPNTCHYHDAVGVGYIETCDGANGHFVDACSADLTTKKVYTCGSGNCNLAETACSAEKQCHILSTGQPACQTCDFTALRNVNGPADVVNAGASFIIYYDVLGTSSLATGGVRPYEHRALFDNDGVKVAWHWNDITGCSWSSFGFSPTAPSTGGSKTYTIKSLATTSSSEPAWASITPDATITVPVTVNAKPTISAALKNPADNRYLTSAPDVASGTQIRIDLSASDDSGLSSMQWADTGSPNTYSNSAACGGSGNTSCPGSWTITPAAGSWTFDAVAFDTSGLSSDAVRRGPINVVNSCASWTGNTPSISNAQYVNYASCSAGVSCNSGEEVHIAHEGRTESGYDFANICGTSFSASWGGTMGESGDNTVTDCNSQTAVVTFTSDYSGHNYDGVTISGVTCHSTDSLAPTTTDNSDANWHQDDQTITLTCTDNVGGIGCDKTYYCVDTSGPIDCDPRLPPAGVGTQGSSVTVTQTGWLRYYSTDLNSNTETVKNSANLVKVDKNNPTSVFGASTPADGDWVNSNGFSVSVTDADTGGSNLAACKYSVCTDVTGGCTAAEWTVLNENRITASCTGSSVTSAKTITVGASGNCQTQGTGKCQVQVYAVDNAGRSNSVAYRTYKVDYTAPTSSITALPGTSAETFDVSWTSVDNPLIDGSGVKQIDIDASVNGGAWSAWATCTNVLPCWSAGKLSYTGTAGTTYAFRSKATDNAGNAESAHAAADTSTKVVGQPGLESPTDSSDITILTPTLDWSAATGANCYAVQIICTDASCAENALKDEAIVNNPSTSYTIPASKLAWQKSYVWKVWPSATGCTSYRSPTQWAFNTKLPAPVINSPADSVSTSPTPALEWQRSGNANYYKIEFETTGQTKRTDYKSSTSDPISYTVSTALLQGKTYTWRVFASNDGGSTYSPFASPDRTFTTAGVCSGLPVAADCDEYPPSALSTTETMWTTPQVEASMITTLAPSYWKVTLPSMYQAYSPTPTDDGTRPVESYEFKVTAKVQSGTVTPIVKIGTTAGGSEICTGGSSCVEGVAPGAYYIKIEASPGSGNVYPEIRFKVSSSSCGVANPPWNPDTVADSDSIDVGGCTVTIKHLAKDVTDKDKPGDFGAGRLKDLLGLVDQQLSGHWERSRTIEFDDSPSGGCDMDLKFMNQWEVGVDGNPRLIKVFNMKQDKDAGNTLSYGYRLESANCVFVPGSTGSCFDDPDVAGNDCANSPSYDADKKGVVWIQNVKKSGAPPPDDERAQNVEYYNVWQCDSADNTNTAGYNAFCASKNSNIPYCDVNLKKCEACSIVNNIGYDSTKSVSENSGKPNPVDCPAVNNPNDPNTVGKCNVESTATGSIGGSCQYFGTCDTNTDCSTSCCSKQTSPGPGEAPGKCIKPDSPKNPTDYQPYLCKNV